MIELTKAASRDAEELYRMHVRVFRPLLDKYHDYETNPAAEPFEQFQRYFQENSDCYFIEAGGKRVGALRVVRQSEKECYLSSVFVLPEYQRHGYAQRALIAVEKLYPMAERWILYTIKQEPKLLHLYEKVGYRQTGREDQIKEDMDLVFYEKII